MSIDIIYRLDINGKIIPLTNEDIAQREIDNLPISANIPQFITRAQGKIALSRAGLLDIVKNMVVRDPEIEIWFNDSITWERNNVYINTLATWLNLNKTQVDQLFISAATISI